MSPPTASNASAMSLALRVGVPLNNRCSKKCDVPASPSGSSREPTSNQNPTDAERTSRIRSVTMVTPLSSVVRCQLIDAPSLAVASARSPLAPGPSPPFARASATVAPIAVAPALAAAPSTGGGGARLVEGLAVSDLTLEPRHRRERNTPGRVDLGHLDLDLVSRVDRIFDALDPALTELAYVHEAVTSGGDVDECTEGRRLDHGPANSLTNFGKTRVDGVLYQLGGRVRGPLVGGADPDGPVLVDIDLDTRGRRDHVDVLALGPDQLADLVDRYLDRHHPRSEGGKLGARAGERFLHLRNDVKSCSVCGLKRVGKDVGRNTWNLHVQLQGGNHVLRPG